MFVRIYTNNNTNNNNIKTFICKQNGDNIVFYNIPFITLNKKTRKILKNDRNYKLFNLSNKIFIDENKLEKLIDKYDIKPFYGNIYQHGSNIQIIDDFELYDVLFFINRGIIQKINF